MAAPAEPILASSLWNPNQAQTASVQRSTTAKAPSLAIGVNGVDDILARIIKQGQITCMSTQQGSGERELCEAIVVAHLLSSPDAVATVVDTGSSFDVRRTYETILLHMKDRSDASGVALKVLDRLHIMKVFDFEGLMDALAELRQSLENPKRAGIARTPEVRGTIGDSEDEDEMLDIQNSPAQPATQARPTVTPTNAVRSLLLIDNLPQIFVPLLKSNYAHGQALLMSLMRSLSHLTRTHHLCTIVINGTSQYAKSKEDTPSAFSSCTVRPLLGKAFTHLLDSHLLIHQTLKGSRELKHDDEGEVSTVEILQSRHGNDVGRWAVFTVDTAGRMRSVE